MYVIFANKLFVFVSELIALGNKVSLNCFEHVSTVLSRKDAHGCGSRVRAARPALPRLSLELN